MINAADNPADYLFVKAKTDAILRATKMRHLWPNRPDRTDSSRRTAPSPLPVASESPSGENLITDASSLGVARCNTRPVAASRSFIPAGIPGVFCKGPRLNGLPTAAFHAANEAQGVTALCDKQTQESCYGVLSGG
jgi:hypothetical protein